MPLGRRPLIIGTAMSGLILTAAPVRATEFAAPCGPLRGLVQDGVATYLGIPYAAPPVGRLRYASPRRQRRAAPAGVSGLGLMADHGTVPPQPGPSATRPRPLHDRHRPQRRR